MNFFKPLALSGVLLLAFSCSNSDVNTNEEENFQNARTISEETDSGSSLRGVLKASESLSRTEDVPDRVGFAYDSNSLTGDQKRILDAQILYIKKNSDVIKKINIGGYCDERGSIDYNLGLGSRRANAVKAYYVSKGVDSKMIETISYGKNVVLVEGSNEEAWKENRVAKVRLCSTSNC